MLRQRLPYIIGLYIYIYIYVHGWRSRLNESPRVFLYKHFSQTFCYKQYLDYVEVDKLIYALTRHRVASHRLPVETGRWNKRNSILLEDRTCCTWNDLEDKYHFVLVCPLIGSLRKNYISIYFRKYRCMFKFIDLCNNNNAQIFRNLVLYCYKALELRNTTSYI